MKAKFYQLILTVLLSSWAIAATQAQCPINIISFEKTDACFQQNNGTATIQASGGTSTTYYFQLVRFNGTAFAPVSEVFVESDTYTFENIVPANNYRINILNGECDAIQTPFFNIGELTDITINSSLVQTVDNERCAIPYNGQIDLTGAVSGSTGSYEYSIDNGASFRATPVFDSLAAGTYRILVRDSNGCEKESGDIVINDNLNVPSVSLSPDPAVVCVNENLMLTAAVTGGVAPFTHAWTGNTSLLSVTDSDTTTFNASATGMYDFIYTVTDVNGCSAQATLTVTVNQDDASFAYTTNSYCLTSDPAAPSSIATPGGIFTAIPTGLALDTLSGEITPEMSSAGVYDITYTTNGPCPASSTVQVEIYEAPTVYDQSFSVCESTPGSGTANVNLEDLNTLIDGGMGLTIVWFTDSTINNQVPDATNVDVTDSTGFYARATDANGCYSVAEVTYLVNPLPEDVNNVRAEDVQCTSFVAHWDNTANTHTEAYRIELFDGPTLVDSRYEPSTTTHVTFSGLTAGTTYSFVVTAENSCGNNAADPVNVALLGVPSTPTNIQVVDLGCTDFEIRWDAVPGVTDYLFNVYTDAAGTSLLSSDTLPDSGQPTIANTTTGLSNNTDYYYTVAARNSCHTSDFSALQGVTTLDVPAAPAALNATGISCTEFTANWTGSTGDMFYTLELILAGGDFGAPLSVDTVMAPAAALGYDTLMAGTDYQFRVTAHNACGSSTPTVSPVVSTTPAPAVPAGLIVTDPTCTGFTLDWGTVADATGYTVELYTDVALTILGSSTAVTANTLTYDTLAAGSTYYVRVEALSDCGQHSGFSAAIEASTSDVPAAPADPQFADVLCTSLNATWTSAAFATAYRVQLAVDGDFTTLADSVTVDAAETSFVFNGLNPETSYTFRVSALNTCDSSSFVVSAPATTRALPPADTAAIVICEDSPGTLQATVSLEDLEAALDNGGTYTVTWYRAYDPATQAVSDEITTPTAEEVSNGQSVYALINDGFCQNVATRTYTVNPTDDAGFAYPASSYCQDGTDPTPIDIATSGGTFTGSAGLSIDNMTGSIDLSASTAGPHTVTYTTGGDCPDDSTVNIEILPAQDASFSYAPAAFCQNEPAPVLTVATPGGVFSMPEGLAIDPAGVINPAASTPGIYTITYSLPEDCPAESTFEVTVHAAPDPTFDYSSGTYCQDDTNPTPVTTTSGGVFEANDPGLVFVDITTGEINLAASTARAEAYVITYVLSNANCTDSLERSVTITSTPPDATFSYAPNAVCHNAGTNPVPSFAAGASGGTFTSNDPGLFVDAGTGVVNLAASQPGVYIVTNTIPASGSCPASSDTANITIHDLPDATFSYGATEFCINQDTNPVPDVTGGAFSNAEGLVDPVTGAFNLAGATAGTSYTINRTVTDAATNCENSTSVVITVNPADDPGVTYAATEYCLGDAIPAPVVVTPNGTFSTNNGTAINTDGSIDAATLSPGSFTVEYITGGTCADTSYTSITIHEVPVVPSASMEVPVCEDTPGIGSAAVNLADQHVAIDPAGTYAIQWYPNNTLNDAEEITDLNVTVANGQQFFAKVSNSNDCHTVVAVTYQVGSLPVLASLTDDVCEDDPGSGMATVDLTDYQDAMGTGYTYTWYEDAGLTAEVATPASVTVNSNATFYAQADNNGCTASASLEITIVDQPSVSFSGLEASYCAGETTTVNLTSNQTSGTFSGAGITDNGDGTATFTPPATAGSYTISFSYTENGCTATFSQPVTINDCVGGVAAEFTADDTEICAGDTVTFTNLSSGDASWAWNFGPNASPSSSTEENPVVVYAADGIYNVSLTVNGDGATTVTKTDYITVNAYDDATFSYAEGATEFCVNEAIAAPADLVAPGVFSADQGLVINPDGSIPAGNAAGTYRIAYTTTSDCPDTSFVDITLHAAPDSSFTYASSTFCQQDENPRPNFVATPNGTFSNNQGLTVDATDGTIDLSSAIPGTTYMILYTVETTVCTAVGEFEVTIQEAPDAAFSYSASTYCKDELNNPIADIVGTTGGDFTLEATGEALPANGELDLAAMAAGTYNIVYTVDNTNGCTDSDTVTVTLIDRPDPSFTYDDGTADGVITFCQSDSNPAPVVDGTAGGSFSANSVNIILSVDGTIDLANSHSGTYAITYRFDGACPADSTLNVTIQAAPDASFTYASATYCVDDTQSPVPDFKATENGSFSVVESNFDIDPVTGEIILANTLASADPYHIVHTVASGGCAATDTFAVHIINSPADATFSYASTAYCQYGEHPVPEPGATIGQITASSPELVVDPYTGEIDLTASQPGTYTLTNTIDPTGSCGGDVQTFEIEILDAPNPQFTYGNTTFCKTDEVLIPVKATDGGNFSADNGLPINATSGEIDLGLADPGTYNVFYSFTGACSAIDSVVLTITDPGDATFGYANGNTFCEGHAGATTPEPGFTTGGTFSNAEGLVDPATGAIDLSLATVGNAYTIVYTLPGDCGDTHSVVVEYLPTATATLSYGGTEFCQNAGMLTPTVTGTLEGLFAASSSTVSLDAEGNIDLANSTDGSYTITYTPPGTCVVPVSVDITINPAGDEVVVAYAKDSYCREESTNPVPTITPGMEGGTFEANPTDEASMSVLTLLPNGEIDLSASDAGEYQIRYVAPGACPDTSTVIITLYEAPSPAYAGEDGSSCTLDYELSGNVPDNGAAGSWSQVSGPGTITFANPSAPNTLATASMAGTYTLAWELDNGCTSRDEVQMMFTSPMVFNPVVSYEAFCDQDNPTGAIRMEISGGSNTTYDVAWTNIVTGGATADGGQNLAGTDIKVRLGYTNPPGRLGVVSGIYRIEALDNGTGCDSSAVFLVKNRDIGSNLTLEPTTPSCEGNTDGEIRIRFAGTSNDGYNIHVLDSLGQPVLTELAASIGNPQLDYSVNNLSAGLFYVQIEDIGSACKAADTVRVLPPTPITFTDVVATDASCFGGSDGSLGLTVSGGSGAYTYLWTRNGETFAGNNTEDLADIPAGAYTLQITDGTCSVDLGYAITINEPAQVDGPIANEPHSIHCGEFTISWSDQSADSYEVDLSTNPEFSDIVFNRTEVEALQLTINDHDVSEGFTSNTTYYYRVRSNFDGCEPSNYSNVEEATTLVAEPTTTASAMVGCNQFTARWNSVDQATQYYVDVATDDAFNDILTDYSSVIVLATDTALVVNTQVDAGETYYYRVRAESCGVSADSDIRTVTLAAAPAMPVVNASATCDTIMLNWDNQGATAYRVVITDVSNNTVRDELTAATSLTVGDLAPGSYQYQVTARNTCYDSDPAEGTIAIPALAAWPADAVSTSAVTCTSFSLHWSAVDNAAEYVVSLYEEGEPTPLPAYNQQVLNNTEESYAFIDLMPGMTYRYVLAARDNCGNQVTTENTETMGSTPAEPVIAADEPAISCTTATLAWGAVADAGGYEVEVSTDGTFTDPAAVVYYRNDVIATTTTLDIPAGNLVAETTYHYRIRALSTADCGNSDFDEDQFTTNPVASCGCGHEKADFIVSKEDVSCLGSVDGALSVTTLYDIEVDYSRFSYKYKSLTQPEDSSGYEVLPAGFQTWGKNNLPAGEYEIYIRDMNAQESCGADTVKIFRRTIGVEHALSYTTKPESCDGSDGEITVNLTESCIAAPSYELIWRNVDTGALIPTESGTQTKVTGLVTGNYEIILRNDQDEDLTVLSVNLDKNCSNNGGSGEPAIICELGADTFVEYTTSVDCDNSTGSVIFAVNGGEDNRYTFAVRSQATNESIIKSGTGSASFENLAIGSYTYEVADPNSGAQCISAFTIGQSVPVISEATYTLPSCDAPEQLAEITVTLSVESTAPAPYDVTALLNGTIASTAVVEVGTNTAVLTGLPTGEAYELVVQSRADNTCPAKRVIEIPQTGEIEISFDVAPVDITCFGESGSVIISNLMVADGEAFTLNLYQTDEATPYMSRILQIAPSSYTFTNVEPGEYQLQVAQQQTTCGSLVSTQRSAVFSITGPESEFTATLDDQVSVTVNDPQGDIFVRDIKGGGLPYEIRIAAGPENTATDWQEVVNDNPVIEDHKFTFADLPRGTYVVQLRDKFGCMLTHTVEIRYTEQLYIPNIITPNRDGQNDTFYIVNLDEIARDQSASMIISNRWGRVIYRNEQYTNDKAWDGEDYPDGVYYYHLKIPGENGGSYSGWLEIWRGRMP